MAKRQLTWLSDTEWARIEPLLPQGRKGAHRVDDRRVISGIVHMLKIGARWRDCPPEYGPYTTIYNRFHRWSRQGVVRDLRSAHRLYRGLGLGRDRLDEHQGPPFGGGRKRGAFEQAIGTSRGGRTSKLHGLTDATGRPRILMLSPGNLSDMTMAPALIEAANGRFTRLIADKGYDSNAIRAAIQAQGAEVGIPATSARKAPIPYDRDAYRTRNLVERLWCRLKDWRRIATRYDKLARNYLSGVFIVATLTFRCAN